MRKTQGINFFYITGSVASVQLCHCSTKAARQNPYVKKHVCLPRGLYLREKDHSCLGPSGHRMPTLACCRQVATKSQKVGILATYQFENNHTSPRISQKRRTSPHTLWQCSRWASVGAPLQCNLLVFKGLLMWNRYILLGYKSKECFSREDRLGS